MAKVLVVDQFYGYTPYYLSRHPRTFQSLCEELLLDKEGQNQLLEVDDDFRPPMATTVIREGKDGMAEVWKMR